MYRKWLVKKTFKALGDIRGDESEKLALEAFQNHVEQRRNENSDAYWWLRQVRLKDQKEDRLGVDIVFETVKGNYGINVKSSIRFVEDHKEKYPRIPVVVVDSATDLENVALNVIREIYNKFYKKGSDGNFTTK